MPARTVTQDTVIADVHATLGITLTHESTGGNCTGLHGHLESGHHITLTDSNGMYCAPGEYSWTVEDDGIDIGYEGVTITIDDDTDRVLTVVCTPATPPAEAVTRALTILASGGRRTNTRRPSAQ